MVKLRQYQQDLVDSVYRELDSGIRSVCVCSGCGSGKSITAGQIALNATDSGEHVLFIVHRKELCEQIRSTFYDVVGVPEDMCDICMVQTVSRRIKKYDPGQSNLIICDECHQSVSTSHRKVFEHFCDAKIVGFTATPIRLNRGGLGDVYEKLIVGPDTQWLIENHFLSPYKYYSAPMVDTTKLHTRAGEFAQDEVNALMENGTIYGDTVRQWEKFAKGKKTIVYCSSVEAADRTAERFFMSGVPAMSLSGSDNAGHRAEVMRRFRTGDITVLTNCELFGEGLDVPDCECVVLLRPTQSLTLFIQQSMRSMRYLPGKTAVIIDHVGNCYMMRLPL